MHHGGSVRAFGTAGASRPLRFIFSQEVSSPQVPGEGICVFHAGFRPRTTRSFCFGKRPQNHWRPDVALRVPAPQSRLFGLRNSLRSDSPRPHIEFAGPGRSHARRRREKNKPTTLDSRLKMSRMTEGGRRKEGRAKALSLSVMPDSDRASSVLGVPAFVKNNDAGFSRSQE